MNSHCFDAILALGDRTASGSLTVVIAFLMGMAIPLSAAAEQKERCVRDAVTAYASGDLDAAVRILELPSLRVRHFTDELDSWMSADEAGTPERRRMIAAAFALDVVWRATRTPANARRVNLDPWKRVTPDDPDRVPLTSVVAQALVATWAVQALVQSGEPGETERLTWLVAVGIAEDGHSWHQLRTQILPLARERLGPEPRLRLAEVLAVTNRDLGPLRASGLRRSADVLRVEHLPSGVKSRIPRAIGAFEALLNDEALAAEAALRIGYLELRRGQWSAALEHLGLARTTSTDPVLRAAADYFAAWVHEQEGRTDAAIEAYRHALGADMTRRNVALRLAALLFLDNSRSEAYEILERTFNAPEAGPDLLVAIERGDGRFVNEWLTALRAALR